MRLVQQKKEKPMLIADWDSTVNELLQALSEIWTGLDLSLKQKLEVE